MNCITVDTFKATHCYYLAYWEKCDWILNLKQTRFSENNALLECVESAIFYCLESVVVQFLSKVVQVPPLLAF